ncbi:MAG TPA: HypC/HybG/HupF family hydrogenase formation chaperone [Pirellulales bacterium]|jgi:hydrogenase expression/formation protein HypC
MCLGIPGRIVDTYQENDMPMGKVDFSGIQKRICLAHTPAATTGQYVIVHVGFSLQVIDEDEARQVFNFLERMNELSELRSDGEVDSGPDSSDFAKPAPTIRETDP